MARNTRTFSDFDLNFLKHPDTDSLVMKYDEQSIKQAVRNLILTNHYERQFHPEIGSQVKGLLFEHATPMLAATLKQAIINTINAHEPRVRLIDVNVTVSPDNNEVYVSVEFTIVNTNRPIVLNVILERTR